MRLLAQVLAGGVDLDDLGALGARVLDRAQFNRSIRHRVSSQAPGRRADRRLAHVERDPAERPVAGAEREERPRAEAGLESLEEVQKLLRRLPTREREVVRLFYLEGRSYEEISAELHIPVKGQTLRGKVKWREADEIGIAFVSDAGVEAPPASDDELAIRVARLEGEIAALKQMVKRLQRATASITDAA